MASECMTHDRRVDEVKNADDDTKLGGEEIISEAKKKPGKDQKDDIKEGTSITSPDISASEEKSQSEFFSVVGVAKKEERHEKDREAKVLVPEPGAIEPAAETNEVQEKEGILDTIAFKENSQGEKVEVEGLAKEDPESAIEDVNESEIQIKEAVPAEISIVAPYVSDEPGKNNVDPNAPTSIEVPVKDLEVECGSPEEQKREVSKDDHLDAKNPTKENPESSAGDVTELINLKDSKDRTKKPEPADVYKESGKIEVDPNAPTSIEVPVKDLEVESGSPEEQKQEVSHALEKTNADPNVPSSIALPVKDLEAESGSPEEQKEEILAEDITDVSEASEKIYADSDAPISSEVPVKDVGVESGSPEEQKQVKREEARQPSLDETTVAGGGEVVSSSSNEVKASGYTKELEKRDNSVDEEWMKPPLEAKRDLEAETNATQLNEGKVIEGVAPKKDDERFKDGVKGSEPGDSNLKVAEVLSEGDKSAEKEKDMNIEAEKGDLVEKSTGLSSTELPYEEVKASEASEIIKDVENDAVSSDREKETAGDDKKSEILKQEDADLVEATKEFSPIKESIEQVIEENTESSKSEKDAVKDTEASEKIEEKKNETSKDVNIDEKKVEETEDVELGAEKEESEKAKDGDLNVTSETGDAKIVKERESNNIFSKFKRSIVKAKKAILRKSPGPNSVSSEVKDE